MNASEAWGMFGVLIVMAMYQTVMMIVGLFWLQSVERQLRAIDRKLDERRPEGCGHDVPFAEFGTDAPADDGDWDYLNDPDGWKNR